MKQLLLAIVALAILIIGAAIFYRPNSSGKPRPTPAPAPAPAPAAPKADETTEQEEGLFRRLGRKIAGFFSGEEEQKVENRSAHKASQARKSSGSATKTLGAASDAAAASDTSSPSTATSCDAP